MAGVGCNTPASAQYSIIRGRKSLRVRRRAHENRYDPVVDWLYFIGGWISAETKLANTPDFLQPYAVHVPIVSSISRARRALGIRNTQCLCATEVAGAHV